MELLLRGRLNLTSVKAELTERSLNIDTYTKVANQYWRLRRRADGQPATARDSELVGVLGFWLLTMRMMYYTTRPNDRDWPWEHRRCRLNRIFDDPAVRQVFAKLYSFPHGDLLLDTASIHQLGTTSFILRCRSRRDGDEDALKCILYPYLDIEAIASATAEYHNRYGHELVDRLRRRVLPMARVYASRRQWIRMDFIHGRTLQEALRSGPDADDGPYKLPIERLRKYGVPLLEALRDVPYPHQDLSPSNVMVIEHAAEGDRPASVDVVLIDFGENYVLTRDVGSGKVPAETTRHVAPELLRSRGSSEPSGYEDVYSVGQILLDIVRHGESESGFIRNKLYMDAPFLGRLVEDLVDEDPTKRLLLVQADARSLLDANDRRAIYTELRDTLQQGIRAYEELATVTPTSAASLRRDRPGWRRVADHMIRRVGALMMALSVVRRPVNFLRLSRQGGSVGNEYSYLFAWASLCSVSWAVGWAATLNRLGVNAAWKLIVLLPGDLLTLLLAGSPNTLLRHIRAIASLPVTAWDDLLFRVVLITVIVTAAKYYMEIFAGLSVRRLPFSAGHRTIEIIMRMTGVVFGPIMVAANAYAPSDWLPLGGLTVVPIIINNLTSWILAKRLVQRAEMAFSTVRQSDLAHAVDLYSEWWKLMLVYGAIMTVVGLLIALGWARDLPEYSILVITANIMKLYRSNCGKLAPWVRGTLARSYTSGERLYALEQRKGLSPSSRRLPPN